MKKIKQFILFGLVGVSNTLISEAVYFILILWGCNYVVSSTVGFILSVLNAYYWSNKYVFKEEDGAEKRVWWKVLLKTYVAYIWSFLLNLVLLFVWIDVADISKYMGPLQQILQNCGIGYVETTMLGSLVAEGINLVLTIPMNFFLNKYWAYKQKGRTE